MSLRWRCLRLLSWKVLLLAGLLLSLPSISGDPSATIFFYNPESNVNNFASLKSAMDQYFDKAGHYGFQPFSDRETFEKMALGEGGRLYILSSWHFQTLNARFGLVPLLVGAIDGKTTQRLLLVAKKGNANLQQLQGGSIASAGSEAFTRNLLKEQFPPEQHAMIDTLRILTVPKDIDALIAVGYGLAQGAVTTERSLEMIGTVYPRLRGEIAPIGEGKESLLAIVATAARSEQDTGQVLAAVERMGIDPDGRKLLRMLGLEAWRRIGSQEKRMLGG